MAIPCGGLVIKHRESEHHRQPAHTQVLFTGQHHVGDTRPAANRGRQHGCIVIAGYCNQDIRRQPRVQQRRELAPEAVHHHANADAHRHGQRQRRAGHRQVFREPAGFTQPQSEPQRAGEALAVLAQTAQQRRRGKRRQQGITEDA